MTEIDERHTRAEASNRREPTFDVESLRGRRATNRWERTSVGDVFERLTWSYPDKISLTGACGESEYAALTNARADALANQVAHGLAAAGLVPGDRVMMFCDNTVEAFVTKIGIAKAGMVVAPMNVNLAPDVLRHLVALVEPSAVIVDAEMWPRIAAVVADAGLPAIATIMAGGDVVEGSKPWSEFVAGQPTTEPDVEIHGDDVWELLFTSGTTSLPKAVMITHHSTQVAALSMAVSLTRGLAHECDVRLAVFLPMIYHVGDQPFPFGALMSGGTVHLGRGQTGARVAQALHDDRSTALFVGSPQFAADVLDQLEANIDLDVSACTMVVYGWGAMPPRTLDRLRARFGTQVHVLGVFGQTESIACHRFWPSKWPEAYAATAPSINCVGVPSPMLSSDVVDIDGNSVRGVPGEAVYRSAVMTAGYYRNEEATREAFRDGWFHTGDSVIVDENGLRSLVDRYKDIVKSGGENISSMRVESMLATHPAVARAAVVGLPHPRWGEAVTGVVILHDDATVAEDELIEFCRERLAGYETPKSIVFVAELPETVGKIQKYRLRTDFADLYLSGES
ncbi:AMP-binding protein [Rhodococcus sp. DMU1]|uniref:AMP-binding protein n=1 Tax=Rhodococcus sp. DMU1 TaxID=2722825 RepID=UPI00143EB084|nr:AMP-binding protein [Rhodococcus sp. DMU1]QIX53624.1 AMP-binding protein [Rhodococcus sp. DMU1]